MKQPIVVITVSAFEHIVNTFQRLNQVFINIALSKTLYRRHQSCFQKRGFINRLIRNNIFMLKIINPVFQKMCSDYAMDTVLFPTAADSNAIISFNADTNPVMQIGHLQIS